MEWISFEDKMPPKDGTWFFGYEMGNEEICYYIFNYRYSNWHEVAQGEIAYEVNPTHWMELPSSPKII